MKPIKITVTGTEASVTEKPVLTSGTVGLPVEFIFDEVWAGLAKTAVFRAGSRSYPVACLEDTAIVPWEVMEKPNVTLHIGVFGTDGLDTHIPTVWAQAGTIWQGTHLPDTQPEAPTPQVYDQILAAADDAVQEVTALRQQADSGAFIGPPGPKGDAGVVDFTVVRELPAEADRRKIYLLPEADGEATNRFGEYVFVENAWERIGSAGVEVNLEDYLKVQHPEFPDGTIRGYAYCINPNGDQVLFPTTIVGSAYTIPYRNPGGNFYVGKPTLQYECANKGYVDGLIAELTARIEALEAKLD